MLLSLREETEGKLQMLLSLRKDGLTSLFKEVRVFKEHNPERLWRQNFPLDRRAPDYSSNLCPPKI